MRVLGAAGATGPGGPQDRPGSALRRAGPADAPAGRPRVRERWMTWSRAPGAPPGGVRAGLLALLALAVAAACATRPGSGADLPREEAVAVARAAMGSGSVFTRLTAAGAVLDAGDPEGWQLLLQGLQSADRLTMLAAAGALLDVRSPAVSSVMEVLAARDEGLEQVLVETLVHHPRADGRVLIWRALVSRESRLVVPSLEALARSQRREFRGMVSRLLETPETDPRVRVYALYALAALGSHGPRTVHRLAALAGSGRVGFRELAAVALGEIGGERAKEALATLSEDSSARVRIAALASRTACGDDAAGRRYRAILTGEERALAELAAGALKRLPAPQAVRIAEHTVRCCELQPEVAMRIVESLGWVEGGDASGVLEWALAHPHMLVRMQGLWAIGQRRVRGDLDKAVPFLRDGDPGLRAMAAWAIVYGGRKAESLEPPEALRERGI